ncbi:MAG: DUF131 domain-containing protein [Candidatus Bathyarchaeia archaeon]
MAVDPAMPEMPIIFFIGLALIILGILISFISAMMMFLSSIRERRIGRTKGGGLIMLGPIPIIFGTDKETVKLLIVLSIILIAVALVFMLILGWLQFLR